MILYDPEVSLKLAYYHSDSITGGNKYKLLNHRFHYDLRNDYFSARILLTSGILLLTMLSMLTLSTCSKHA